MAGFQGYMDSQGNKLYVNQKFGFGRIRISYHQKSAFTLQPSEQADILSIPF